MKFEIHKRITAAFLGCLMLLLAFAGCADKNDSDSDTDVPMLTLVADGSTEYVIMRAYDASDDEVGISRTLRSAIKKACGIELELVTELKTHEKAICVGNVPRNSVKSLTEGIKSSDYVIGVSENDLVICGGSAEKTVEAVKRFISEYLTENMQKIEVPQDLLIKETVTGESVDVTVGDVKLSDYSIVLSSSEAIYIMNDVKQMNKYCNESFGFSLNIGAPESANEIIIGKKTSRTMSALLSAELAECKSNQGLIYFENGKIWLTGNTDNAVREAILTFKEEYLDIKKIADGKLNISQENKIAEFLDKEYTVMSFNILYGNGDGGYEEPEVRKEPLLSQIRDANPDILGVQECTEWWYGELCEALGEEYGVVGELNTKTGQRWRNAIFYRKSMFDLVETKTQWLSKTPNMQSKVTLSEQYRVVTTAVLKDKETGKTFAHCNTHMDFEAARQQQFPILIDLVNKVDCPVVITGDFNTQRGSEYYNFIDEAGYGDASAMTSDADTSSSIDFVFAEKSGILVSSHYKMPTHVDGIRPSDHIGIVATFYVR